MSRYSVRPAADRTIPSIPIVSRWHVACWSASTEVEMRTLWIAVSMFGCGVDGRVGTMAESIGTCGPKPESTACSMWTCTTDGWEELPKSDTTVCSICSVSSHCDGDGACVVPALPNLVVHDISFSCDGDAIYEIVNSGQASAGSFWVGVYRDQTLINTHWVPSLATGASVQLTDSVRLRESVFYVVADYTNAICESDESDNTYTQGCLN
jgi:hypothetical protein